MSYRTICTYRYVVGGQTYTGDRMGLLDIGDNLGTWQREAHEKLRTAYDNSQPVTCYVDPRDPAEALLFPELRGELMLFLAAFAVVFGTIGVVGVAGWVSDLGRARRRAAGQPEVSGGWRKRPGSPVMGAWMVAMIVNSLAYVIAAANVRRSAPASYVFGIPPLLSSILVIRAARMSVAEFRYRQRRSRRGRGGAVQVPADRPPS